MSAGGSSSGVMTPTLLACFGVTGAVHAATYLLNAVLPLHLVELGGSKTQVGMLFSVMTVVSMCLRPVVGGWNDRYGFNRVVLPGVAVLLMTLLALSMTRAPAAVVVLMAGLGLSNGLISTSAGVLAARASVPARLGEALSLYYVASSIGFALGAPIGLALYEAGGMRLDLLAAAAMAVIVAVLAWRLGRALPAAPPVARPPFRLYSRHAVPAACALILTNIGHSAIYAFLPLYAIASGLGGNLGWFYALFSGCLIVCRLVLRRTSDRVGRARVLVPAISLVALSYFTLALPPTRVMLAVSAVMLGTGLAVLYPTLLALLVDRTPESERGLAIGTLSASFDVGVVIGSLVVGVTVEQWSFAAGFALAGVSAFLGLATFLLTERARARGRDLPHSAPGVSF